MSGGSLASCWKVGDLSAYRKERFLPIATGIVFFKSGDLSITSAYDAGRRRGSDRSGFRLAVHEDSVGLELFIGSLGGFGASRREIQVSRYLGVLSRLISGRSGFCWLELLPVNMDLGMFIRRVSASDGDGEQGGEAEKAKALPGQ